MHPYDGEVIFSCVDVEGAIDVVDEATARTLHFGTRARQSTMLFRDRHELALTYTRCMMICLVFLEAQPSAVLMLGLGGGSLARFLLHHYPGCHIDAVESRPAVVQLARRFFELPDQPSLCVSEADAASFVQERGVGSYDLVLVDLHTPEGMAPVNGASGFVARCRQLLTAGGVLSINLWSGTDDAMIERVKVELESAFDGAVGYLPVAGKRNFVALGLTSPPDPTHMEEYYNRATNRGSAMAASRTSHHVTGSASAGVTRGS